MLTGFRAGEDSRRPRLERVGDPDDVRERDIALASLDCAVVGAVEAALERERFLGDALFLAYGTDRVAECEVCWRESEDGGSFPICCSEVHGR